MIFLILFSLMVTPLPRPAHAGAEALYPNSTLTPGEVNPILTQDVICAKNFRTGPYRNVSESEKKKVFLEYGIPWAEHSKYEVDHLIALTDGGSNDLLNLWPQPLNVVPGAHQKDQLEVWVHTQICKNGMNLQEAQKRMVTDWYEFYQEMLIEEGKGVPVVGTEVP